MEGMKFLTMEINDYLQSILLRPIYSFVQIKQLALNVGFSACDVKCPVSDWKPYMIEPAFIKFIK